MRKGQITIFIILGLILVLTVAIVLFFISTETQKPLKEIPEVPQDIKPVYDMVNDCTQIALHQGLIKMGMQGGYLDIPAFVTSNPDSFISADPFEVIKIPYWYYNGENRIPSYSLMQMQLGNYVEEQIKECVDIKAFEPELNVKPLDEPNVLITFAELQTIAEVKWHLEITSSQGKATQAEFYGIEDVRFKEMYELALRILEEENRQEWLEELTIDLMASNDNIPMGGMEVTCKQKKWNIEKVMKDLEKILFYNIPLIRIKSTPQLKPLADEDVYEDLKNYGEEIQEKLVDDEIFSVKMPDYIPADVYEINKMTFDIHKAETDLKASFVYTPGRLMLNALPHDGKWLKSSVMKGAKNLIPFFCMNQWHFTYDVIYPIKTVIKDETAMRGEGFVFQFAFPVVISDNSPQRVNFGIRQFQPMYIGSGFCEELGEEEIEITAKAFEPGMPVAMEIEEAEIILQCMNIECEIGKTKIQSNGDISLRTRIPQGCGNPKVIAKKEGYLETSEWLTGREEEILMTRLKELKPEFLILPYQSVLKDWQTEQNRFVLEENEEIMMTLRLKNSSFEQYLKYPSNDTIQLLEDDAEYELEAYLLKNDEMIGGLNADISITYQDLIGRDNIQINVIEYRPNPTTENDIAYMINFINIAENNKIDEEMILPKLT